MLYFVRQAQFIADLLYGGLYLLYAAGTVVSSADYDVEMGLVCSLSLLESCPQDFFRLLDILPVQIYGVAGQIPILCIVLLEYEIGGLLVPPVRFCAVFLGLFAELFSSCAVTTLVGLLRLSGELLAL